MLLFQIFTPTERIENPLLVNLVFCQIVQDVFSKACIRINKDDRMRMKGYLGKDQNIHLRCSREIINFAAFNCLPTGIEINDG